MSTAPAIPLVPARVPRLRFDRHELAGAFGDVGTDLPLLLAMIPVAGLDGASVFIMFGLGQIATGLLYGLPMPMQPLKAMAAIVIAQKATGSQLYGAGIAIGAIMVVLALSGVLTWLQRVIPRCAVRGVQGGLGLMLAQLALSKYVPSMGPPGWWLAGGCFVIALLLWGNRRVPAALVLMAIGCAYALIVVLDVGAVIEHATPTLPHFHVPSGQDIWIGLLVLALPQLPLSLSNSVFATHRALHDLFPDRAISVRKIGLTYGVSNLIVPFFGGVPVCHGCGGLVGHHAFGARTGGSVVMYGLALLLLGLLLGSEATNVIAAFPQPVLGVILLFEAVALLRLMSDVASSRREFTIALLVALIAAGVPYGFGVGMVVGCVLWYARTNIGGSDTPPQGVVPGARSDAT